MAKDNSVCSAKVWDKGAWKSRRCERIAKVERNGVPYCGIHDPVAREQKNERRSAELRQKLDASFAEIKERNRKLADYPRLEAENRKLREAVELALCNLRYDIFPETKSKIQESLGE